MKTQLERLAELEKQVVGLQRQHIELEALVILLDKVVGLSFATGRPPTRQELAFCASSTAQELAAKYSGLGVTITPAAPSPPKLFVPHTVIRPD